MKEDPQSMGILLPQPARFIGCPQAPILPQQAPVFQPFSYPVSSDYPFLWYCIIYILVRCECGVWYLLSDIITFNKLCEFSFSQYFSNIFSHVPLSQYKIYTCRYEYIANLTQHNTRHTSIVRRILSNVWLTQYDMLPQHQVNIRKLISECF